MSFTNDLKNINHDISLEEAIEMTSKFREDIQSMFKPEFPAIGILPVSETFSKSIFETLTLHEDCIAIRCYLGMDEENQVRLLFVGVDADNNDILADDDDETGYIFEYGRRCPPICVDSPLNPQL
jgi:hypothetical protein